ncbi:DUF645 family protein [Vibrio cholerae]|nr:DUF645 family protein [Vibrio cholerae]
MKTHKHRCFNVVDVQHDQLGFIKGCIIAVIWLSLSWTLNRGQLNSWLPTS